MSAIVKTGAWILRYALGYRMDAEEAIDLMRSQYRYCRSEYVRRKLFLSLIRYHLMGSAPVNEDKDGPVSAHRYMAHYNLHDIESLDKHEKIVEAQNELFAQSQILASEASYTLAGEDIQAALDAFRDAIGIDIACRVVSNKFDDPLSKPPILKITPTSALLEGLRSKSLDFVRRWDDRIARVLQEALAEDTPEDMIQDSDGTYATPSSRNVLQPPGTGPSKRKRLWAGET